jgi:predicted transcriptional regulator YdeE
MSNELYNIYCRWRRIYSHLTEEEYFDTMEDLSIEYYQTGSPRPDELDTEIIKENHYGYA